MGTGAGLCLGLVLAAGLAVLPGKTAATAAATVDGPSTARFASAFDAVVAATSAVNARSIREDREYLGAILQRGADYHYSIAPGEAGADRIQVRLTVPAGFAVVALWHTHGAAAPERRYFSPTDRALVETSGVALYLADYSGALHVLVPGTPRLAPLAARRLGLGACRDCAVGERVVTASGVAVRIPTRSAPTVAVAVNN